MSHLINDMKVTVKPTIIKPGAIFVGIQFLRLETLLTVLSLEANLVSDNTIRYHQVTDEVLLGLVIILTQRQLLQSLVNELTNVVILR